MYASALKGLAWFHRWVGVVLCLMFAIWFATGAVMVFVAFPALPGAVAAARSEVIDTSRVAVAPATAAAGLGSPRDLRLVSRNGAPAYVGVQGSHMAALSAVNGKRLARLTPGQALAIASRFAGAPAVSVSAPFDYDQWVVHQQFDPWRPFYRVRLANAARTELYVSALSGEVRQETTQTQRIANWVGSVIHWLYFVPLRRTFAAWDWTVWALSLIALTTVTAGVWLGVTRTSRKMRSKRPALSPYKGLLRWHHVIGLTAGAFILSWILSGWLSMDHGRLFSQGEMPPSLEDRYEKGAGGQRAPDLSVGDLQNLARDPTSIRFGRVGGCNVAASRGPAGVRTLAVCPDRRITGDQAPPALIVSAVRAAWPYEQIQSAAPAREDSPYAKAESLPDGVLQIRMTGERPLRLFIDPASGQVETVMDRSRQAYAWAYYMLHTYNFPGLSDRPALRITILLIPLTLGFVFSITGVLVGVRRLRAFVPARSASRP